MANRQCGWRRAPTIKSLLAQVWQVCHPISGEQGARTKKFPKTVCCVGYGRCWPGVFGVYHDIAAESAKNKGRAARECRPARRRCAPSTVPDTSRRAFGRCKGERRADLSQGAERRNRCRI